MKFSVGVIPIRFQQGTPEFLLLRCFSYWDFPKGEIHPTEDYKKGALRELQEETGITQIKFSWGDVFKETLPYSKGKIARYYLGEVEQGVEVALRPNAQGILEHHEYQWLTFLDARNKLVPRLQEIMDWAKGVLLLQDHSHSLHNHLN